MATAVEREAQAIKNEARIILLIVLLVALLAYAFTALTQVGEEETGLVVRLGRVVKTIGPGLHRKYPWPIDRVVLIPTGVSHNLLVNNFNLPPEEASTQAAKLRENNRYRALGSAAVAVLVSPHLVTGNLNVVHVEAQVKYNIASPEDYYLAAGDFEDVSRTNVQEIARKIVANSLIRTLARKEVMNVLRASSDIPLEVAKLSQEQFDDLHLGITLVKDDPVQIADPGVPSQLKAVFDSETFAQSVKQTQIAFARMQYRQIIDKAAAESSAIKSGARIYAESTVSKARGDAERYAELIKKYHQQGEVVRDRLRYEKLAEVAPFFKVPTVYTTKDEDGKQKLVIIVPEQKEKPNRARGAVEQESR